MRSVASLKRHSSIIRLPERTCSQALNDPPFPTPTVSGDVPGLLATALDLYLGSTSLLRIPMRTALPDTILHPMPPMPSVDVVRVG